MVAYVRAIGERAYSIRESRGRRKPLGFSRVEILIRLKRTFSKSRGVAKSLNARGFESTRRAALVQERNGMSRNRNAVFCGLKGML